MVGTRYPEFTVSGNPRELGRQIGELAKPQVRGFCEVGLERTQQTVDVSRARALEIAESCFGFVEKYRPDYLEELRGTAEAAGVSDTELMLLQIRNQLAPGNDSGCTSLSIAAQATANGCGIVGQNWDNDPVLDDFTIVLTRKPDDRPKSIVVTQAGLIAYLGMNDQGIGACVNTLPAPSRSMGVPHYFTLREIFDSRSLDEVVHAVKRAERAIPANIMLATPQGPADLEVTVDDVQVIRPADQTWLSHTNHCLHANLCRYNDQFPELIDSHPRQERMSQLLDDADRPITIEQVQAALSDHDRHPRSICRHANEDPEHGFWTTVFSLIMEPATGTLYVTRGNPCEQPFEKYQLPIAAK